MSSTERNNKNNNSNLGYEGYELYRGFSCMKKCEECLTEVWIPSVPMNARTPCPKCGSLSRPLKQPQRTEQEIADEIVALLNLKLYN